RRPRPAGQRGDHAAGRRRRGRRRGGDRRGPRRRRGDAGARRAGALVSHTTPSGTPGALGAPGTVAVVGLGKIGLPLAVQIAGRGFVVRGADRSAAVVRQVCAGLPPFPGEAGLPGRLRAVAERRLLTATTDTAAAVAASDV